MFKVMCSDCGRQMNTETAKAMREHATGVYSFVCRECYSASKGLDTEGEQ